MEINPKIMMSCCSTHSKDHCMWTGLVAFILGAVVLLQKFNVIPETTWSYLWPSILVVAGLKLMIGSCENCNKDARCDASGACEMPKKSSKKKK